MGVLKYYNQTTSSWEEAIVGVQGATGATGPTGGTHLHTQTSPSTVWTVIHNLGARYVNVEPVDSFNVSFVGRYDYPEIEFLNNTTLTLTFATPQTGYAAVSLGGMGATGPSLPYQTTSTTGMELITGPVGAGSFDIGRTYRIVELGTTDFTSIGASSNTVGVIFTATGSGTGNGTAHLQQECYVDLSLAYTIGQNIVCVYDVNNYMVGSVSGYNPGTGLLEFFAVGGIGSGYYSAWDINIFTPQGATGLTGATGSTGPMGPPGGTYIYSQPTPQTVWTIVHNLGARFVNVEPADASGQSFVGRYDYPTIDFIDDTTLTLTFTSPTEGFAAISAAGPQGATGASGPIGGTYVHSQTSASTTWTVNHGLNNKYVNVEPVDSSDNSFVGRYDYPTINFIDANSLTLTFTTALTGNVAVSAGGPIGATGATGATGVAGVAQNVLYVSKSGNDSNSGTDLSHAKLTIASAVTAANALIAGGAPMVSIFVKAGDYTEINPISLSAGVSIVGDNLRAVNVRPANPTQDIFWVRNRCYLTGMTFRDHLDPAAAVAFPSTGAGNIFTSPYIQNCSSITTTGAGMRVDGSLATGLRSMVLDSYTQFNQGGLGIHITNQGYAQLVSIFTICCTAGVKCEDGGTCSITNSNNSFGDYGLWAEGVGPVLYSGTLVSNTSTTITVSGLTTRPAVNDAFQITDGVDTQYILVREATPLAAGVSTITFGENLEFTPTPGPVDFRQISLISASSQTFEYVGTGTNILTSTPRLGGIPIQANEIRQTNGGRVNYTSTDQFGDFRIGDGLLISEEAGVIEGTTFDRSLFAVLTPYILALEG